MHRRYLENTVKNGTCQLHKPLQVCVLSFLQWINSQVPNAVSRQADNNPRRTEMVTSVRRLFCLWLVMLVNLKLRRFKCKKCTKVGQLISAKTLGILVLPLKIELCALSYQQYCQQVLYCTSSIFTGCKRSHGITNLTGKAHLCHGHVKYGWQLLLPPILKTLPFSSLTKNNLLFCSLYGIPFHYLFWVMLNHLPSSTKDSKNSGISFTVTQIG